MAKSTGTATSKKAAGTTKKADAKPPKDMKPAAVPASKKTAKAAAPASSKTKAAPAARKPASRPAPKTLPKANADIAPAVEKPWLASYPDIIPAEIGPLPAASIGALLVEACQRFASRPAFTCMDKTISYA